jgi:hypothetical protein
MRSNLSIAVATDDATSRCMVTTRPAAPIQKA